MSNDKKGVNPVVAGLAGAAVGFAAAKLSEEENREAIAEKFGELKEKGGEVMDQLKETAADAKEKLDEFSEMAGDKIDDAKSHMEKKAA